MSDDEQPRGQVPVEATNVGPLPFNLVGDVDVGGLEIPADNAFSRDEANEVLAKLFAEWNVVDDNVKTRLFWMLMKWFARNGTSDRAPMRGHFIVVGQRYSISAIKRIIGVEHLRRFARAYVREIQQSVDSDSTLLDYLSRKYNVERRFANVAFDVAEFLPELTFEQIQVVHRVRHYRVSRTQAQPSVLPPQGAVTRRETYGPSVATPDEELDFPY